MAVQVAEKGVNKKLPDHYILCYVDLRQGSLYQNLRRNLINYKLKLRFLNKFDQKQSKVSFANYILFHKDDDVTGDSFLTQVKDAEQWLENFDVRVVGYYTNGVYYNIDLPSLNTNQNISWVYSFLCHRYSSFSFSRKVFAIINNGLVINKNKNLD